MTRSSACPIPTHSDLADRYRLTGLLLLASSSALLLVWGSTAGVAFGSARPLVATLAAACAGGLALLWIALDPRFANTSLASVFGLALLLRILAVQATPLLEDDHYRYLWDGLRTATALDPYRLAPSAFFAADDLSPQWQDVLSGINNPDLPTIYGPVLQGLFALGYWIAPGRLGALQGVLLVADLAILGLLAGQAVGRRWLLAYAVHPLVLKEAMASAHPDGLIALLLLLALLAWQKRRAVWLGIALGVAVGAKVAALVALPLLLLAPGSEVGSSSAARHRTVWALRVASGFIAALALLYAPFLLVGGSDLNSLHTFASQWRFNPLLYRGFEMIVPPAALRPFAGLVIGAAVAALAWAWVRTPTPTAGNGPPLDAALVLLLLFSPVVNPWYWLWALALAIRCRRTWVPAVSGVAVLSYVNSSVLSEAFPGWLAHTEAPYSVASPLALVQLMVLGLAAYVDRARSGSSASKEPAYSLPAKVSADPCQGEGHRRPSRAISDQGNQHATTPPHSSI